MIFHIGFHIGLVYLNMRYDQFGNFQLYLIDNRYFFFLIFNLVCNYGCQSSFGICQVASHSQPRPTKLLTGVNF